MRLLGASLAALSLIAPPRPSPGGGDDAASVERRAETQRRHGLDPTVPLAARVGPTPPSVLKMFEEGGTPAPTAHSLTGPERVRLVVAFATLPPLHRRMLGERLRTISFLDGMPNTALTSTVNPDEPCPLFDITIRAGVLAEDASTWLTQKERTCFDASGSPLSVSIEAGSRDAIDYVLLHEATHVVDSSLGLTPSSRPDGRPATPFTEGIWADRTTPAPRYREAALGGIRFRPGGRPIPIDRSEATYAALGRTPFASLYGSSNWHDDLAESVALHHWTAVLKQPYRIVIRRDGREVFAVEPMKADLVRGRIGQLERFYRDEPPFRG